MQNDMILFCHSDLSPVNLGDSKSQYISPSLNYDFPQPASDNNLEAKAAKGPFDDFTLWAVNVDQDKMERFGRPERLVLNLVACVTDMGHHHLHHLGPRWGGAGLRARLPWCRRGGNGARLPWR